MISCLKCTACGAEYSATTLMNLCPADGRPVMIINDLERLQAEQPDNSWHQPERRDMWRFGGLLPLDINNPADQQFIVTLGEGATPLLDYSDSAQAKKAGFTLQLKDEGKAHRGFGANPTQSFKDRGMSMTASMALNASVKPISWPSIPVIIVNRPRDFR